MIKGPCGLASTGETLGMKGTLQLCIQTHSTTWLIHTEYVKFFCIITINTFSHLKADIQIWTFFFFLGMIDRAYFPSTDILRPSQRFLQCLLMQPPLSFSSYKVTVNYRLMMHIMYMHWSMDRRAAALFINSYTQSVASICHATGYMAPIEAACQIQGKVCTSVLVCCSRWTKLGNSSLKVGETLQKGLQLSSSSVSDYMWLHGVAEVNILRLSVLLDSC